MDALITILIFIVAAVLSAVFKKKQAEEEAVEDDDWSTPDSPRHRGEAKPTQSRPSWEEELRRLLEGTETPAAPPPPPPPPRPARPVPPPPIPREIARPPTASPSRLRTSEAAFEQARHLDRKAQEHLRRAAERVRLHTPTVRKAAKSSDVETARRLLESPATTRSAVIVSVLLGKPRSLDPYQ